jgi:hypothetical protein
MIEDEGDQEWYVCFMGSRAFRDLSADTEMQNASLYARPRETGEPLKDNPIFAGSHLVHDGIIYRLIPEIDQYYIVGTGTTAAPTGPLAAVGAGSPAIDVSPVFLCGQSAYAYAIGQLPQAKRRDETDYQFLEGMGIEMQYGYGMLAKDKTTNGGSVGTLKNWGVVCGFVSGVADA